MQSSISDQEMKIIELFKQNVYGKAPDTTEFNQRHDGKAGHWLEKQMGILPNANNEPDLYGYEMKNSTGSKTTFGDWSASYYIFSDKENSLDRTRFMEVFGKPNEAKGGRYSWSGSPIPNFNSPSTYNGSEMAFDDAKNIIIVYNYSKDPRPDKANIVPLKLQQEGIVLARWDREKPCRLKTGPPATTARCPPSSAPPSHPAHARSRAHSDADPGGPWPVPGH